MLKLVCVAPAIALALAAPTQAAAQSINPVVRLPSGAVINLVVQKYGERTQGNGTPKIVEGTFRYHQKLVSTAEGYTITQTLVAVDPPVGGRSAMEDVAGAIGVIVFDTDKALSPLRIRDRHVLLESIFTAARKVADPDSSSPEQVNAVVAPLRAVLDSMSDQQLAKVLLREQGSLSKLQSRELDLSQPINREVEMPNPSGGQPIKGAVSIRLDKLEAEAQRAFITMTEQLDPESLLAATNAILAALPSAAREKIVADLAASKLESSTLCSYEMDLKTGLAARANCTNTRRSIGSDGQIHRNLYRTVVSQTLMP